MKVSIPRPPLSSRLIHKEHQDQTLLFCMEIKISFVSISTGNSTLWAANQASPAFKQGTPEDPVAFSQTSLEVHAQGQLVPQILHNKPDNL